MLVALPALCLPGRAAAPAIACRVIGALSQPGACGPPGPIRRWRCWRQTYCHAWLLCFGEKLATACVGGANPAPTSLVASESTCRLSWQRLSRRCTLPLTTRVG